MKARLKADADKKHWEEKRRRLLDQTQQHRTECQALEEQYQVRPATSISIEPTFVPDLACESTGLLREDRYPEESYNHPEGN